MLTLKYDLTDKAYLKSIVCFYKNVKKKTRHMYYFIPQILAHNIFVHPLQHIQLIISSIYRAYLLYVIHYLLVL